MKAIFFLSLILNLVLGFLYWREASRPPLEKTIVETHEKKIYVKVPEPPAATKLMGTHTKSVDKKNEKDHHPEVRELTEFDPKVYEVSVEKVTTDRESYLMEKLELAPEDLQRIEKVKTDFYKQAETLILGHSEPTIEQRRQLLNLEESREAEFSKIMGKEKWERFKKYRDDYNRRQYENQRDEQSVFIPMDI